MSWLKIACAERDAIFHAERDEKLRPLSGCTDMSGELHGGDPQMDITWGLASTDTPVLRETRYPARESGQPDRKPCEHYAFQDDGW
ncbi:MAG: hypothetical protein WBB07_17410 [Mycobacterium sp.]